MLRRTPVLAVLLSLAITFIGMAPTQAEAPDATISVSNATIFPAINTGKWPGTTAITTEVGGSSTPVAYLDIRLNDGVTLVKRFSGDSAEWNGTNTAGEAVPAGTYTVFALNSSEEEAGATANVVVSRQHLIRKTFRPTNVNAGRYAIKYVGRCSTLRKPSRRGWAGSAGFYANTKCKTQTWNASAVVGVYVVRVPGAARYIDMHVDTYGGAAKAKPRSRAAIEYWSNTLNDWTATKFVASNVGWHNGLTRSATPMVDSDRYLGWRFAAAYKSQYDVKQFRVVVRYDVLSAS